MSRCQRRNGFSSSRAEANVTLLKRRLHELIGWDESVWLSLSLEWIVRDLNWAKTDAPVGYNSNLRARKSREKTALVVRNATWRLVIQQRVYKHSIDTKRQATFHNVSTYFSFTTTRCEWRDARCERDCKDIKSKEKREKKWMRYHARPRQDILHKKRWRESDRGRKQRRIT